ncbi:LANO_0B00782g1_1 [Lachancea nothofagi CBS 11611]|uniref:LANO_0B00782g1_1 n=1 Tax=Lachancea nothofagi CBS 11611 TaxID=1266666 RepID=A0A1G4IUD5_9SACH|nr:LANO_0B00782g1_1 [Lachancea nothofagi CBS 11611]
MSLFTALNFTPDEALQEAEQHSRELQVEESFKVYQSALLHLKAKRFEQAEEKFKELFSIDVIKPDRWGYYKYRSVTLDSLRYLAYRNRGVFYYRFLQDRYTNMEPPDIVEYTLKSVENLLDALQHSECDSAVTEILLAIFASFRSLKLQRYVLEYELLKDSELTTALDRRNSVLPEIRAVIQNYVHLLKDLRDTSSLKADFVTQLTRFLQPHNNPSVDSRSKLPPFLAQIRHMRLEDDLSLKEPNVVNVEINELSWEAVADAITSALPKYKISNFFSRISDPYNEAEDPIEHLKLILKDNSNDQIVVKADQEKLEIKDKEEPHDKSQQNEAGIVANPSAPNGAPANDSNGTKRPLETSDSNDRPLQRSSKRFKEKPQIEVNKKSMDIHENFFRMINDLSAALDLEFEMSVDKIGPSDIPSEVPEFSAMSDFYDCLSSWTNKHSEFLNQTETKNSKNSESDVESLFQLNALIRTGVLSGDNCPIESLTDLPTDQIVSFVGQVNTHNLHFQEVRFRLLNVLLSANLDGRCLIIDTFWSPVLYKAVESLVMSVDVNLFNMITEGGNKLLSLGLSTYEILVNMMGNTYSGINAKKLQGQKVNELETQKNKLERKISRWELIFEDSKSNGERFHYRFLWAKFCFLQYTMDITDDKLIDSLQEIESGIKKHAPNVNVPYSNYSTIPQLNLKAVQSQLSRLKIIRKITSIDINTPENNNDVATEQQMESIRKVLISDESLSSDSSGEKLSMENFLRNSPFLLKVKLWRLLVSYYGHRDKGMAVSIFFKILDILYSRLCSQDYRAQSHLQRQQTLLLTISCMGSFMREFLDLIVENPNHELMDKGTATSNMRILLRCLNLLYPIVFFESMCQKDPTMKSFFNKAVKSSTRLKNVFIDTLTSIIYMRHVLEVNEPFAFSKQCKLSHLIDASHELLGGFGFCDASDGMYLNLAERLLCGIGDEDGFKHIKQLLWCQYHFIISGENSNVDQHSTKGQTMNQESAVAIGKFLINSHYGERNPLTLSGNKTNLKQVLDNIIQVIGEVDFSSHHILSRNEFFLEQYLRSMITMDTFRKAYAGELSLELIKPNNDLQNVADAGIFYVASIQALNLYKARKKATQARPSELDSIISTLKTDIVFKTGRFESWFLLGKCYSYVVEDDLIWTSDKLATYEKRMGPATIQRKSILCYLMALGIAINEGTKGAADLKNYDYYQVLKELLETLSEELMNGYLKPMEKSCFHWDPPASFKLKMDGELSTAPSAGAQTVSDYNIQQAILTGFSKADQIDCVQSSTQSPPLNWRNFFYSAKLMFKRCTQEFKIAGTDLLLEACKLSEDMSNAKDLILEPHYFLIVSSFKMMTKGVSTAQEALMTMRRNNAVFKKDDEFWTFGENESYEGISQSFYEKTVSLLRALIALDKMKWHHRPKYRIAKILYEQFHDLDGAIAEMDEVMFVKSSNKSLVNIWKPEFERPGKHFIYTYQYVMFYLDLLFCRNDFSNIALVAKKLKKFGAGMVNVALATERALKLFGQAVQVRFGVNEKQATDKLLPTLNYVHFIKCSEDIFQTFDKSKYDPEMLATLTHALQLKKGNNGYDGICLALYFTHIYQPWVSAKNELLKTSSESQIEPEKLTENELEISGTPVKGKTPTNRKKVSKRDAFEKITALVEKKIT